jgi:integrase
MHAIEMFRKLQDRALKSALAGGRERAAAAAITVREEAATYVAEVARKVSKHGRPTSQTTLSAYRTQLEAFAVWCDARGVQLLSQLELGTLKAWLNSRLDTPAHGRARKVSTVNQEVKPVRQMLIAAAQAEHLHLSTDVIRGALKRRTQPANKPRCLSVEEIRATLQAALDYDARPSQPRGKRVMAPLAPAVAVALLSGMRRRELAEVQCGEVLFNAASQFDPSIKTGHDLIDLPGHKTKTGAPRGVLLAPYSPLLGLLLRALTQGRPRTHRVFGIGYQSLGDRVWMLRDYGAPADLNIKMLRSTCATCQRPLPGDLKSKAERLGHTLAVAEAYYLAAPTGLPMAAPDLETVMQCHAEVREVLARVHAARAQSTTKGRK